MVRREIFNKYALNHVIGEFALQRHAALWETVRPHLCGGMTGSEAGIYKLIIDGAFDRTIACGDRNVGEDLMNVSVLRVFAIVCVAFAVGRLVARVRLPAILGWLITGVVFGPYLAGVVSAKIVDAMWYKIAIKVFECFAGVMIGREILFKKLAKTGKQILGITFVQSIGTFLFVSLVFGVLLLCMGVPVYLAFIFGGIALATAPAPALSIVNEYHTRGPVTQTLIPLAAIDDIIGVVVFFTVISVVSAVKGAESVSVLVIVNLGMPLDYRLIAGAGLFTAVYILSRALGKIGGAYLGGKWTKAPDTVTRYLGFTLLPHSGVSLVFTGIAATTLSSIDPSLAAIVQGTIVAAAIINEVIAVVIAKYTFQWAGEIQTR